MESTRIPVEKFDGTKWTPFDISVQDAMNQVDAKLWPIATSKLASASTASSGLGCISSSTTTGTSGTTPSKSAAAAMDPALDSKALAIIRSNCHKDVKVHIYSATSASDAMVTLKAVFMSGNMAHLSTREEGRKERVRVWLALAPLIFGLSPASGDSQEPYLFSLHGPIGRQAGLHSSRLGIFSKCSATWFVLAVVEGK
ncbi:hypothetical protein MARPO_0018s0027 [Marchantia polymorpha]|uniref:Uncharacterized protein n=1 Tax=Marchantia polymorpha TaxID=3197 RepID=A0A2R6XFF9_MARPO|nr:hypothetical protein MARPO_0018s0027 [Marchantia polymorpha]|eukprot:PTQ44836.1 hypothetical protein MARPO_0018s0027 [Marchantia polymorpha]